MIAALLVLSIALADIAGWVAARFAPVRRRVGVQLIAIVVASALVAGGSLLFAHIGWWAVAVFVAGVTWPILTELWPALTIGYFATIASAVLLTDPIQIGTSESAWSPSLLLIVAVTAFLGLSANLVCRAALDRARVTDAPGLVSAPAQPSTPAALRQAFEARYVPAPRQPGQLRGGRIIGPLERWFILFLALTGAQSIIIALLAAKGIVRFPEINKDEKNGTKAEEFLIGSLISWGLAGGGAVLVLSSVPGF